MEITKPLELDELEAKKLASHSLLNALSIISSVCSLIEYDLNDDGLLSKNLTMIEEVKAMLHKSDQLLSTLNEISDFEKKFFLELDKTLKTVDPQKLSDVEEELENLKSIFIVVEARAKEFVRRLDSGITWKIYKIEDLEKNFSQFFNAVEKNAKGRYKIIYNIADKKSGDYLIHFKIESERGDTIYLPDILIDIIRDLISNARKFTTPGGIIDAGLSEHKNDLLFSVSDTGMGIPENEIESVIQYGYRATNSRSKKTFGGGFGLTKAYEFIRKSGGRFWIESGLEKGTIVRFKLPKPKA